MAAKKQPESETRQIPEAANGWFGLFLKHVEIFMVETGQGFASEADEKVFHLAAVRAVKLALLESGLPSEEILALFGRVALEENQMPSDLKWTDELNKRRFELIDGDIQGKLDAAEQAELAGLTQLLREQVDSEVNLPLEGARKLHRLLSESTTESTELGQ